MLQATKDIPAVAKMLQTARKVLGYDLLQLCLEGPKNKLDQTQHAQVPASGHTCLRAGNAGSLQAAADHRPPSA